MEDNYVNNFFKAGLEYSFAFIHENFGDVYEYGDDEVVGEYFLVIRDYRGNVASFVLSSATGREYYYKCIYLN